MQQSSCNAQFTRICVMIFWLRYSGGGTSYQGIPEAPLLPSAVLRPAHKTRLRKKECCFNVFLSDCWTCWDVRKEPRNLRPRRSPPRSPCSGSRPSRSSRRRRRKTLGGERESSKLQDNVVIERDTWHAAVVRDGKPRSGAASSVSAPICTDNKFLKTTIRTGS